ncbi:uncharacterized protein LOC122064275 [Macadamia integrifolia]|uniref:uncharacterized protein LOC122064275 n=1 Tax=Macadamia integrifolia TaxID=60698 RepID=UPI001C4F758C|nr:uncharacterized protein LOC122064275 [Macadamia integrifolia]
MSGFSTNPGRLWLPMKMNPTVGRHPRGLRVERALRTATSLSPKKCVPSEDTNRHFSILQEVRSYEAKSNTPMYIVTQICPVCLQGKKKCRKKLNVFHAGTRNYLKPFVKVQQLHLTVILRLQYSSKSMEHISGKCLLFKWWSFRNIFANGLASIQMW